MAGWQGWCDNSSIEWQGKQWQERGWHQWQSAGWTGRAAVAGQAPTASSSWEGAGAQDETAVADANETAVANETAGAQEDAANETAVADEDTANETAVADADADRSPGTATPQVFDLEYFRTFRPFTRGYKQHNEALKWFRDTLEPQGIKFRTFSNTNPILVQECVHPPGMDYWFAGEPRLPWRWQEIVAQLDEDSMERVVYGLPDGPAHLADRSRGIVSRGVRETDTYDHKRHSAFKKPKRAPPPDVLLCVWDFVLECDDGTFVSLHPTYGNTKFACYKGAPATDHELRRTGKGGSNGPSTFKYFLNKNKGKIEVRWAEKAKA